MEIEPRDRASRPRREEAWEALTEPERLEEWFANEVELERAGAARRVPLGRRRRAARGRRDGRGGGATRPALGRRRRRRADLDEQPGGTPCASARPRPSGASRWSSRRSPRGRSRRRASSPRSPTRAADSCVERLAARDARRQTELAGELPITRQAVAKHLATLEQAGLVRAERRGRETRLPARLRAAAATRPRWLERVGARVGRAPRGARAARRAPPGVSRPRASAADDRRR